MENIVEYMVVRSSTLGRIDTINNLEKQVNDLMILGWKPQGGISLIKYESGDYWIATQAMVR